MRSPVFVRRSIDGSIMQLPSLVRDKSKDSAPTLVLGMMFGLVYQIYKYDIGADSLLNVRLALIMLSGVFFFYSIHYIDSRLMSVLVTKYDADIDRENLKTYAPFSLLLFYPLQKNFADVIWPGSLFLPFFAISVILVLLLKAVLVIRIRKQADLFSERRLPGKLPLCVICAGIGLFFFLFHQVTMVFGDYYQLIRTGTPETRYVFANYESREALIHRATLSEPIPYENSAVMVAHKILAFSPEVREISTSVPFLFQICVRSESGEVLLKERRVMDALHPDAARWTEIKFSVPRARSRTIHFRMKARPLILRVSPRFFLNLLCHNPFDFTYFRKLSISAAWSTPEIVASDRRRPDVFLISIDTLRADRVGCYGYGQDVSPAINSLARDGVLYRNAFSQSTWTLPSHKSLLTGRFPSELSEIQLMKSIEHIKGSPDITKGAHMFFSQILNEKGYYSVAYTDGALVSHYYGFHMGFHLYNEQFGKEGNSFHLARRWLSRNKEKDVFMFIHTFLVHDYRQDYRADGGTLSDAYDKRVRQVDADIGDFMAFLKQDDIYENALIIFTSDHGESFGEEHNDGKTYLQEHTGKPYESQIRVPLIIKPPGGRFASASRVIFEDVQLIDVAPTILTILGIRIPEMFRGHPLRPFHKESMEAPDKFIYATGRKPSTGCIRKNNMKYIYHSGVKEEEFYDLMSDPLEIHNLASDKLPEMAEMRETYDKFQKQFGTGGISLKEATAVDSPDLRERLKALGYLQ